MYFDVNSNFQAIDIDISMIENIFVPPNVWHPQSKGRFINFKDYLETQSDDPNDARNVILTGNNYIRPLERLTLGRYQGKLLLIDGFHRAARFLKFGPKDGTLGVHMPK